MTRSEPDVERVSVWFPKRCYCIIVALLGVHAAINETRGFDHQSQRVRSTDRKENKSASRRLRERSTSNERWTLEVCTGCPAPPRPVGPAARGVGRATRKGYTAGAGRVRAGIFWCGLRGGLTAYHCGAGRGGQETAAGQPLQVRALL